MESVNVDGRLTGYEPAGQNHNDGSVRWKTGVTVDQRGQQQQVASGWAHAGRRTTAK
jgi:hypothetical protein